MAVSLQFSTCFAAHADWSVDPRKRWITKAHWRAGRWWIAAPEPVAAAQTLLARLGDEAAGAPVAFGVDFPLGLPRAYAARAGIANFPVWLRSVTPDAPLFQPCATMADVSIERPFYPKSSIAGAGQMTRLATVLGLADAGALRRDVDRQTARRPAGAPMFWTMGANQCGKAALAAWRDCLLPGFAQHRTIALWPFDGGFTDLLAPNATTVAETYPAEALVQLGLKLPGSKRRQADRAALAGALVTVLGRYDATPDCTLDAMIADGFGFTPDGEDRFDSLLGLLAVIRVIAGAPDGVQHVEPPHDPAIAAVEGWVLGQVDRPLVPATASIPQNPNPPPHPIRRQPRRDRMADGSG